MSLIQDALKRQQEENNDGAARPPLSSLAMPVDAAPAGDPPAEASTPPTESAPAPAVARPGLQARAPQAAPEGGQTSPRWTPPQPIETRSGAVPWKKIGGVFIFCCLLAWMIILAISFVQKQDCLRITLLTDHDNQKAIRFYEKFMFTKSAMIPMRLVFD